MRSRSIAATVISLLVVAFGGIPVNSWADDAITSKELYLSCQTLLEDSPEPHDFGSGLCIGYFSAVNDSLIAYRSLGKTPLVLGCVPFGIPEAVASSIFASYLQNNPSQIDDPAISTILKAFTEKYPPTCHLKE